VCDPCCCEEASVVPEGAAPSQSEPQLAPPKKESGGGDLRPVPRWARRESPPSRPGQEQHGGPFRSRPTDYPVPAGAKVFINGYETRSQGTHRQYVSTGLAAGNLYPYAITVMVPRAPQTTSQTVADPQWDTRVETVYLKAGNTSAWTSSARRSGCWWPGPSDPRVVWQQPRDAQRSTPAVDCRCGGSSLTWQRETAGGWNGAGQGGAGEKDGWVMRLAA